MSGFRWVLVWGASLLVAAAAVVRPAPVLAQAAGAKAKIPAPEDLTLETKDGVSLKATFYGGLGKKDSVPIIMLHGWDGARGEYDTLAKGLQNQGHSVIAPDLRGHGQSLVQMTRDNSTRDLDREKFRQADLEAMVWDVEACKKFLLEKNNQGALNINALCVIGADLGSIIAVRWAAMDLTAPPLLTIKQGQDVKALVLLSPTQAFKGVTMREGLSVPAVRSELSMMIVAGADDNKGTQEAKRLHTSLVNFHYKPGKDKEENAKKQSLFLVQPPTSLQGTKLLGPGLPVMQQISGFIDLRLTKKLAEYPWSDRKRPE
jgi:pimeloyl-ACP methyl ester carboxylesterase